MTFLENTNISSILFCLSFIGIYAIILGLNRIHSSPLKNFPGPKLAAATFWYEFYYDVILGGQYTFKIRRLHEKYGPIIRINPYEIHVYTPEFFDELYNSGSKRRDKWYWTTKALGADESAFTTVLHETHRMRRAAIYPFFSKNQVKKFEPIIQERVDAILGRLKDFRDSGSVVRLDMAFAAFSADVVMNYTFGRSERKVNAVDFDGSFHGAMVNGTKSCFLMRQFPSIFRIMKALPSGILLRLNPSWTSFIRAQKDIGIQVRELMAHQSTDEKSNNIHSTIFQSILNSKLPVSEKSFRRLAQEGGTILGAGTTTTAWAITVAVFYLVTQAETLSKLKSELLAALPVPGQVAHQSYLEQLPYLSAVIQESLRLSYGVCTRLQRVAPNEIITYVDPDTSKRWHIPAGTPISMTSLLIFQNSRIFPEPLIFRPERWIENPQLDRYQIAFSKGPRSCLGANISMAELYLTLAGIFRVYGSKEVRMSGDVGILEPFETDLSDIECCIDGFLPLPKKDTKGVRFLVKQ